MNTLIRYLIVAVLAYFIDMGGFYLLLELGNHPVKANIFVKIFAAVFGFFMHRRYTYKITEVDGQKMHAIKYFGLVFVYTPVSRFILFIFMLVIPEPLYSKAISDLLLFIVTFWVTSKFAFIRNTTVTGATNNN